MREDRHPGLLTCTAFPLKELRVKEELSEAAGALQTEGTAGTKAPIHNEFAVSWTQEESQTWEVVLVPEWMRQKSQARMRQ